MIPRLFAISRVTFFVVAFKVIAKIYCATIILVKDRKEKAIF